jgi:hypothetical protein
MIYFSIDLETTGLDPDNNQILQIGAIMEDTNKKLPFDKCPMFECIINHDTITGSPFAINMNSNIITILSEIPNDDDSNYSDYFAENKIAYNEEHAIKLLQGFIHKCYNDLNIDIPLDKDGKLEIIVAGKNFEAFDLKFLNKIDEFKNTIKPHRRVLDPVTLFTDFKNDDVPPNFSKCLKRLNKKTGYHRTEVMHDAIADAWDVIEMLRTRY